MNEAGPGAPPPAVLSHLRRLTGPFGIFEHARFDEPRLDHGYTTDDNARVLVVLSSGTGGHDPDLNPYLDYVISGRTGSGWHNRMSILGTWSDARGPDDSHGRALWGLGCVMAMRGGGGARARSAFMAGLDFDSPHPRANAYAVLGAVEAISVEPDSVRVERFLRRVSAALPRPGIGAWRWPEPRLSYDNGRIPEALIAAGSALGDQGMVDDGLLLLSWLVEVEQGASGFSFTPVAGRGRGERGPAFDQQPIEAWAMADACLRAAKADRSSQWLRFIDLAGAWFMGRNDSGAILYDPLTGAGFDGLEPHGVNRNRGAESTLAALGCLSAWSSARASVEA